MAEAAQPAPAAEPATPCRIVITFSGPGLADLAITHEGGVTDAQAYAAAFMLDCWAREIRQSILQQAALRQIVPARGVPFDIRGGRTHG